MSDLSAFNRSARRRTQQGLAYAANVKGAYGRKAVPAAVRACFHGPHFLQRAAFKPTSSPILSYLKKKRKKRLESCFFVFIFLHLFEICVRPRVPPLGARRGLILQLTYYHHAGLITF